MLDSLVLTLGVLDQPSILTANVACIDVQRGACVVLVHLAEEDILGTAALDALDLFGQLLHPL